MFSTPAFEVYRTVGTTDYRVQYPGCQVPLYRGIVLPLGSTVVAR